MKTPYLESSGTFFRSVGAKCRHRARGFARQAVAFACYRLAEVGMNVACQPMKKIVSNTGSFGLLIQVSGVLDAVRAVSDHYSANVGWQ